MFHSSWIAKVAGYWIGWRCTGKRRDFILGRDCSWLWGISWSYGGHWWRGENYFPKVDFRYHVLWLLFPSILLCWRSTTFKSIASHIRKSNTVDIFQRQNVENYLISWIGECNCDIFGCSQISRVLCLCSHCLGQISIGACHQSMQPSCSLYQQHYRPIKRGTKTHQQEGKMFPYGYRGNRMTTDYGPYVRCKQSLRNPEAWQTFSANVEAICAHYFRNDGTLFPNTWQLSSTTFEIAIILQVLATLMQQTSLLHSILPLLPI